MIVPAGTRTSPRATTRAGGGRCRRDRSQSIGRVRPSRTTTRTASISTTGTAARTRTREHAWTRAHPVRHRGRRGTAATATKMWTSPPTIDGDTLLSRSLTTATGSPRSTRPPTGIAEAQAPCTSSVARSVPCHLSRLPAHFCPPAWSPSRASSPDRPSEGRTPGRWSAVDQRRQRFGSPDRRVFPSCPVRLKCDPHATATGPLISARRLPPGTLLRRRHVRTYAR